MSLLMTLSGDIFDALAVYDHARIARKIEMRIQADNETRNTVVRMERRRLRLEGGVV